MRTYHDLLRRLDLSIAIIFGRTVGRIKGSAINGAMFEVEMEGIVPAVPCVNDMQGYISRAAFFELRSLERHAIRAEMTEWGCALQQIVFARNDDQLFRP